MVGRAAGIYGAVVVTDEIERLVFGNHEVAGSNLAVGRSGNDFFPAPGLVQQGTRRSIY